MFTLIAMGTGAAWICSVIATLAPGTFPDVFCQHDGSVAVFFEAAAVITVLVLLGQVLELRTRESTRGAIRALPTKPIVHAVTVSPNPHCHDLLESAGRIQQISDHHDASTSDPSALRDDCCNQFCTITALLTEGVRVAPPTDGEVVPGIFTDRSGRTPEKILRPPPSPAAA